MGCLAQYLAQEGHLTHESTWYLKKSFCCKACGILVPQLGIAPRPPALEAESYPLGCQGSPSPLCALLFEPPSPDVLHPGCSQSLRVSSCMMKGPPPAIFPEVRLLCLAGWVASGPCCRFWVNTGCVLPCNSRGAGFGDRCGGRGRVFPERALTS